MLYAGIDVHKRTLDIAVLDAETGCVVAREERLAATPESLRLWARDWEGKIEGIAFEATTGWAWVADVLSSSGHTPRMANPAVVKAMRGKSRKPKTDKIDAEWLAYLLAKSMLPECWMPPEDIRELREVMRYRRSLVNERTKHYEKLHAICQQAGFATEKAHVSAKSARPWIMALPLGGGKKLVVESHYRLIDAVEMEIDQCESYIRQRWGADPRVKALQTLVGIGLVIACELVAEIGDALRFSSPKKLVRYAGLDPTVSESGNSKYRGRLAKQGSPYLRTALILAAHQARRTTHPRHAQYMHISRKKGAGVAVVNTARLLLQDILPVFQAAEMEPAA